MGRTRLRLTCLARSRASLKAEFLDEAEADDAEAELDKSLILHTGTN